MFGLVVSWSLFDCTILSVALKREDGGGASGGGEGSCLCDWGTRVAKFWLVQHQQPRGHRETGFQQGIWRTDVQDLDVNYQEDLTLYLSPFDPEVSTSRELRVFVSNWEVTAISQYAWTNPSSHFSDMADDELVKVGFLVDQFNRGQVSSAWRRAGGIDCYVMDVEVVFEKTGHSVVRLIELNTFGAEFSSGSALYHWLRDDHILQGRTQGEDLRANDAINSLPVLRKVYFRVLCSKSSKLWC